MSHYRSMAAACWTRKEGTPYHNRAEKKNLRKEDYIQKVE